MRPLEKFETARHGKANILVSTANEFVVPKLKEIGFRVEIFELDEFASFPILMITKGKKSTMSMVWMEFSTRCELQQPTKIQLLRQYVNLLHKGPIKQYDLNFMLVLINLTYPDLTRYWVGTVDEVPQMTAPQFVVLTEVKPLIGKILK